MLPAPRWGLYCTTGPIQQRVTSSSQRSQARNDSPTPSTKVHPLPSKARSISGEVLSTWPKRPFQTAARLVSFKANAVRASLQFTKGQFSKPIVLKDAERSICLEAPKHDSVIKAKTTGTKRLPIQRLVGRTPFLNVSLPHEERGTAAWMGRSRPCPP